MIFEKHRGKQCCMVQFFRGFYVQLLVFTKKQKWRIDHLGDPLHFFFLMGFLWPASYHPSVRFLDCLLKEPRPLSHSFYSGVPDRCPTHLDSTETADPLLGMVIHLPVRVILQTTSLSGQPLHFAMKVYAHASPLVTCHALINTWSPAQGRNRAKKEDVVWIWRLGHLNPGPSEWQPCVLTIL